MDNNTVVLTTLLNGEQAKRELDELKVSSKTLSMTIDDLRKKGDFALAKTLEPELKEVRKAMNELRRQTIDVNHVLSNLNTSKPKELRDALRTMNSQLNSGSVKRGSQEWDALNSKMRLVNNELTKISSESRVAESRMSRFANGFNKYFAGVTTIVATITGASFTLRKLSEDMAKMDDNYADVQKTTGLAREQVVELNEGFKQMDTRTAREQLNMLARDAGKLGISAKEDVQQFVEAGNQIDVALGEDLGEGAIRNIGKITEVFKLSTKELDRLDLKGRMLAVGSAINELGQSSTANEAYLVEFSQRLGGVASQAGLSIQDILGYASALDQSGQKVEMSATALQKFIMSIMEDPAKFAKIAGIEVGKFNQLLKSDTNEAIKTVLKSLSEKGGFQQLIPIFKEMGLDGARAVGVLTSLATNIGVVNEAQSVSNKAFTEATGITDEYNVKNENMMARLEKQKNKFKDAALELGERLNPALLKSTNYVTYLVKILPSVLDFLTKYGPALIKITALILAYNLGVKAQIMWTKLNIIEKGKLFIANSKEIAQMTILSLRYVFASKSAEQLNRSLKALWGTTKLNPAGLVLAGVVALIYGLTKWRQHNNKLISESNALVDINKKVASSIGSERAELDLLLGIAKNEKISKSERIKAITKLNEISPEYLGNLNIENINTDYARIATEKYTKALIENAQQKAIGDKMSELYSKRIDKQAKIAEQEARKLGAGSEIRGIADRNIILIQRDIKAIDQEIQVYQKLGEAISANKKTATQAYAEKWRQLENEKQILTEIEQKHADLYNAQQPSSVLKDSTKWGPDATVSDKAQLQFLTKRVEGQKALIEQRKKELEVLRLIVAEEENETDSTTGGGFDDAKDPTKAREAALSTSLAKELLVLKQGLLNKTITEDEYKANAYLAEVKHLLSMIELRKEYNLETVDVETKLTDLMISESNRRYSALQALQKQSLDDVKNRTGEQATDEDWSPQGYSDEKKLLDTQHEYGLISEEQYQESLLQLKLGYLDEFGEKAKAAAEGVEDIARNLSGALDGFQQSEEMAIESKYDKMIEAAGSNSKKVAKLEEEKEKKLHAIRSKYADKQFIVTVAGVIASTALSAMESYKSAAAIPVVGHILGPIAAAAAVGFGASQIAIAKQQRDAAKEGYAGGGFTQPGNWWEEDGAVHKGEFVGNRYAVANPTVRKVFNIVDQAQRTNTVGSLSERDFQTALNYNEYSQRRIIKDALSGISQQTSGGESYSQLADVLARSAEINAKLSKQLEEPITAETYIEGKRGSKEANDLYTKMKKNISRS